jgi:hypothetical protein
MAKLPGFREAMPKGDGSAPHAPSPRTPRAAGDVRRRPMGLLLRSPFRKSEHAPQIACTPGEPHMTLGTDALRHEPATTRGDELWKPTVRLARRPRKQAWGGGKGIFSRQREAREQALIVSLAGMGLEEMASSRMRVLRDRGCKPGKSAIDAVEAMREGQHIWRSKWTQFRPVPSFAMNEEKRNLIGEYRRSVAQDKAVRASMVQGEAESELRRRATQDICEYDEHVMALDMWQLKVFMPFKTANYSRIVNTDGQVTLGELKQNIFELEGFHPAQQILYVLEAEKPPSPQKVTTKIPHHLYKHMHAIAIDPPPKTRRVLLPREGSDEASLTNLGIHSGTMFEMEVDKKVGKELQRQMLMKEIGIEGDTFDLKTQEVFEKFDVDEGGTIEGDELGMTMKSLGIYLTEEEIDELIDKYDENGDCQFDIEEFRTMVRDIITGDIHERSVVAVHKHAHGPIHRYHGEELESQAGQCSRQHGMPSPAPSSRTSVTRAEVSFESTSSVREDKSSPRSPGRISRLPSAHEAGDGFVRTRSALSRATSSVHEEAAQLIQQAGSGGMLTRTPSASFLYLKAGSHFLQDSGHQDETITATDDNGVPAQVGSPGSFVDLLPHQEKYVAHGMVATDSNP